MNGDPGLLLGVAAWAMMMESASTSTSKTLLKILIRFQLDSHTLRPLNCCQEIIPSFPLALDVQLQFPSNWSKWNYLNKKNKRKEKQQKKRKKFQKATRQDSLSTRREIIFHKMIKIKEKKPRRWWKNEEGDRKTMNLETQYNRTTESNHQSANQDLLAHDCTLLQPRRAGQNPHSIST